MFEASVLHTLFAIFALLLQAALVLHFAALRWRPNWQQRWGWLVYALSLPGLGLGLLFWLNHQPWYDWMPTVLLAAWAALGYTIDIARPINWRTPLQWPIFIPYLSLYLAAQFSFWIPLWFIGIGYWVSYTILYAINTALNIPTHFKPHGPKVI